MAENGENFEQSQIEFSRSSCGVLIRLHDLSYLSVSITRPRASECGKEKLLTPNYLRAHLKKADAEIPPV